MMMVGLEVGADAHLSPSTSKDGLLVNPTDRNGPGQSPVTPRGGLVREYLAEFFVGERRGCC
jgi:hypothetical protein